MVANISWTSYWIAVVVFATCYYAYVVLSYYRQELFSQFTSKATSSVAIALQQGTNNVNQSSHVDQEAGRDELLHAAANLSDELMAYLEQAGHNRLGNDELLRGLSQVLKKFGILNESRYQVAINSLVQFETWRKFSIHLSEEEIMKMWLVR